MHTDVWEVLPLNPGYLSTSQRVRKSSVSHVCPEHCPRLGHGVQKGTAWCLGFSRKEAWQLDYNPQAIFQTVGTNGKD